MPRDGVGDPVDLRPGGIPEDDARATFNLGIGMIVVCAPAERDALASHLQGSGETVADLGEIVPGERGVEWVEGR